MNKLWDACLTLAWRRLNWLAQLPFWLFAGYIPDFDEWMEEVEQP